MVAGTVQGAETCKVIDPELQGTYAGPCKNGFAEGRGRAVGSAEFTGGFKAGKKHGKGVKSWPNGDRYEGEFSEDFLHGVGAYTWGRGPYEGERYEGGYRFDRRHGFGTYRWPTGDVYVGPWANDAMTGPATPMMIARAKFAEEAMKAVGKLGQKVCRRMPVGIGNHEWIRGEVVGVEPPKVAIRIAEPGTQRHLLGEIELRKGEIVWGSPQDWTPCL